MSLILLGAAPHPWANRIAEHLKGEAAVARSLPPANQSASNRAHIASLEHLAEYLRGGIPADDARHAFFSNLFHATDRKTDQKYEPSPTARRLISALGKRGANGLGTVDPLDALIELAAAELDDHTKKVQRLRGRVGKAEQTAEAAVRDKDALASERDDLADQLAVARAAVHDAAAEWDSERAKVAHLSGRLAVLEGGGSQAAEPKRRRRKAYGEQHIYITDQADGGVQYEVKVQNSGWKTFTSEKEAKRYGDLKLNGRAAIENTEGIFETADGAIEIEWREGEETRRKTLPAGTTPEQAVEAHLALIERRSGRRPWRRGDREAVIS